ncbi:MAG: hypothetical protein NTW64_04575 [Candidatus Omnitrophica bacterium]|nr:hypothetical protein [Candidatus Omnitrophota bacterium]
MRRLFFIVLALVFILNFSAYCLDTKLFDMRNKIFEESKKIKLLVGTSQDLVLINSMWDSCIMCMSQLDAYFSMLGVFNTIKKENLTEVAVDYLTNWLTEIKNTNELNIKSLDSVIVTMDPNTKPRMEKLKGYFKEVNNQINSELNKISSIKQSLQKR